MEVAFVDPPVYGQSTDDYISVVDDMYRVYVLHKGKIVKRADVRSAVSKYGWIVPGARYIPDTDEVLLVTYSTPKYYENVLLDEFVAKFTLANEFRVLRVSIAGEPKVTEVHTFKVPSVPVSIEEFYATVAVFYDKVYVATMTNVVELDTESGRSTVIRNPELGVWYDREHREWNGRVGMYTFVDKIGDCLYAYWVRLNEYILLKKCKDDSKVSLLIASNYAEKRYDLDRFQEIAEGEVYYRIAQKYRRLVVPSYYYFAYSRCTKDTVAVTVNGTVHLVCNKEGDCKLKTVQADMLCKNILDDGVILDPSGRAVKRLFTGKMVPLWSNSGGMSADDATLVYYSDSGYFLKLFGRSTRPLRKEDINSVECHPVPGNIPCYVWYYPPENVYVLTCSVQK